MSESAAQAFDKAMQEAMVNSSGMPFPERVEDIALEVTLSLIIWLIETAAEAVSTDPGPPVPVVCGHGLSERRARCRRDDARRGGLKAR